MCVECREISVGRNSSSGGKVRGPQLKGMREGPRGPKSVVRRTISDVVCHNRRGVLVCD